MTKGEFKIYISSDNFGFYKTRKSHINKIAPEILIEIEKFIDNYKLTPIDFSDKIKYYLRNVNEQNYCVCGEIMGIDNIFCSKLCSKKNIKLTLTKTKNTLQERYGESSPLKIKKFKKKFEKTCETKFGYLHPSKNKDISSKIKKTNKKTYENKELRKKIGNKISNAYKKNADEIINKRKQTNFLKHNEFKILTTIAINNSKTTLKKKYGVSNPFAIHKDTYELAKLGSINFYKDDLNKTKAIKKRVNTIISKYGSLEEMNRKIFIKKQKIVINNLQKLGIKDKIVEYNYNKLGFVTCKCTKCNKTYNISLRLLRERTKRNDICCTICSPPLSKWVSNGEIEIYNWLSKHITCEQNNRKILKGKEIDIFIPNKNIAIEFNGIYWHSDLFKDKNYHLNKSIFLKEKKIELFHIWEDLWDNKKEIIKGRILSKLNIDQNNVGARKTVLKEINSTEANIFYELNHLQGKTKGLIHIALIYDNEIVSCMSIGKRKLGKNRMGMYELLRFCNKIGFKVMGSFSKLFKYIKEKYSGNYISYADLCWGEGNVYEQAGFKLTHYSKPNYWYFIENKRYHRYNFNKQRLIKLGYDKNKTEFKIMDEDVKALRVYDCGNAVWELNI